MDGRRARRADRRDHRLPVREGSIPGCRPPPGATTAGRRSRAASGMVTDRLGLLPVVAATAANTGGRRATPGTTAGRTPHDPPGLGRRRLHRPAHRLGPRQTPPPHARHRQAKKPRRSRRFPRCRAAGAVRDGGSVAGRLCSRLVNRAGRAYGSRSTACRPESSSGLVTTRQTLRYSRGEAVSLRDIGEPAGIPQQYPPSDAAYTPLGRHSRSPYPTLANGCRAARVRAAPTAYGSRSSPLSGTVGRCSVSPVTAVPWTCARPPRLRRRSRPGRHARHPGQRLRPRRADDPRAGGAEPEPGQRRVVVLPRGSGSSGIRAAACATAGTDCAVLQALRACLGRMSQWTQHSRRVLAEVRYALRGTVRPEAPLLRQAFGLAAIGRTVPASWGCTACCSVKGGATSRRHRQRDPVPSSRAALCPGNRKRGRRAGAVKPGGGGLRRPL